MENHARLFYNMPYVVTTHGLFLHTTRGIELYLIVDC